MADFTPIRVSELPEVTNVGENDYLVVDDGIQTSKIKSKNYNERSSGSAKEYADEAARSASLSTERAEAAAQSVIQVDALAQNASESANNALDYSRDAEAWAKGTRDGSAVPITDATHENNAKYFAQQAQNSATSAAESADAAEELLVSAIDPTLTQDGKAADAKKTGDELTNLKSAIEQIEPGLSGDAKAALLACFRNVAWINDDGATYYANLETALYGDYPKLIAAFDPGINVIYTDDALNTLKQYLTVTYYATEDSSGVILSPSDYTLSGTLIVGTSIVVVTYRNLSTTVAIPGVVDFYNIWEWDSRFTGAGKMTRTPVRGMQFTYEGTPRKGILYDTSLIAGNNNRGFATLRGKAPMVTQDNVTLSEYYPVPVPATANKLTAKITPITQRLSPVLFTYDQNDNTPAPYNRYSTQEWHTSEVTMTFEAVDNLFLAFNCSVDASFTQYTSETEPEMNVLFERE